MFTGAKLWALIVALGAGTYLIRFSFLGLLGARVLPDWVLRHLRYAAHAVLPALVAPLVLWPAATGGQPDPARLIAAFVAAAVGWWWRSTLASVLAGALALAAGLWLSG